MNGDSVGGGGMRYGARSRTLAAAAAVAATLLLGLASGAAAQTADTESRIPRAPVVNGATCTGPLSMPVPAARLGRDPGNTHSAELALLAPLVAGTYIVSAGSSDVSHPTATNQPNEIWTAVFWSAANVTVGQTEATPDLASSDTSQAWSLGNLVLTDTATRVEYFHAAPPSTTEIDSIKVDCLNLTLVPLSDAGCTGVLLPAAGMKLARSGFGGPDATPVFPITALIAGTYGVSAGSRDVTHPGALTQIGEQWQAVFFAAGGAVVGTTQATPDLPDADVTKSFALAPLVLTGTAVSLQYVHANVPHADLGDQNIDSIEPLCLGLTAPVYPPAPPVVQPVPPVVPPAPEVIVDPKPGPAPDPEKIVELPKAEPPKVVSNPPANPVNPVIEAAPDVARVAVVPVVTVAPVTTVAPPAAAPAVEPAVVKVAGIQVIATPENGTQVLGAVVVRPVAFTGANSIPMALAGVALFGIGAVLLVGARRRQPRTTARLR